MYIKDLRVIDRKMKNVLLIDNAAYSFGFQVDNGVPCLPFYDNPGDKELRDLVEYAKQLALENDMIEFNRNYFQLHKWTEDENYEELIQKLLMF